MMTYRKISPDTSNELLIQRWNNGIKLIHPDKIDKKGNRFVENTLYQTVKDLMNLPLSVYFLNAEHMIQTLNETSAEICGFASVEDSIGKTVCNIAKRETADRTLNYDLEVMKENKMKIREENVSRLDEIDFQAISVKFPWYNNNNETIGVFGFSMIVGIPNSCSLANGLELIYKTGLLNNVSHTSNIRQIVPGSNILDIYLSKRESECLYYLLRGMTAKSIAKALLLSHRTVECYLENVKIKLGVSSKIELIEKLYKHFEFVEKKFTNNECVESRV